MKDKKDFYIFLDHDGVFNFNKWMLKIKGSELESKGYSFEFCPANLKVFNKILKTIRENGFNPIIVITSNRRNEEMQNFINNFKKFGIDYDKEYDKTGKQDLYKIYEIASYSDKHNIDINDNFIIIDDDANDIKRHYNIHACHFLQTSGLSGTGLNNDDFKRFKENNLPQIIELSIENTL
jgi:hypothetical protein